MSRNHFTPHRQVCIPAAETISHPIAKCVFQPQKPFHTPSPSVYASRRNHFTPHRQVCMCIQVCWCVCVCLLKFVNWCVQALSPEGVLCIVVGLAYMLIQAWCSVVQNARLPLPSLSRLLHLCLLLI
jgi:hypothetical protein